LQQQEAKKAIQAANGQAVNITFLSLVTKGGQLLNGCFISSEDIIPSPGYLKGWRIFKMTAVALGPKILSRTRFQGI